MTSDISGFRVLSFPLTNEMFLRAIFGDRWRNALFACFPGDPDNKLDQDWTAWPATKLPDKQIQQNMNMYFCPSMTTGTRRTIDAFESLNVIILDDYGDKVTPGEPEKILGPPSFKVETSPGSFHAGWIIEPRRNLVWVKSFLNELRTVLGAGDNLRDPVIWRRLPVGLNGKLKARDIMGNPWQTRLAR